MAFDINTNIASLQAQQYLRVNSNFQAKTINEVTSGLRIVSSGDDAAGLAVANGYSSEQAVIGQGLHDPVIHGPVVGVDPAGRRIRLDVLPAGVDARELEPAVLHRREVGVRGGEVEHLLHVHAVKAGRGVCLRHRSAQGENDDCNNCP